ncbi:MAG: DUF1684 domain-containing protein [Cyclobacteriaceae bacterium]|nr:DUF1684 domain-containing protein [Cyclobacteriaceae bacterium]
MRIVYLLISLFFVTACGSKQSKEMPLDVEAYKTEIEAWHKKRVEDLKGPKGWLNLVGLYWLNDGINTFGSGSQNNIVFPQGKIPDRAGFFLLKQNSVTIETLPGVDIMSNGKPIKSLVVYHPDSAKAVVQDYGSLQWFIIKRDNKFGVRIRDFESSGIQNFTGIERFPVDPLWRLQATFERALDSTKTIPITNVLGQTTNQPSPGTLIFSIDGSEYRLDVLDEGGDEYFVIVGDNTNTHETYGAGRYMYVKPPDSNGKTIIDFNKIYNPPCAFTSFATCPLPPKQNVLNISITAGEKNYGMNH